MYPTVSFHVCFTLKVTVSPPCLTTSIGFCGYGVCPLTWTKTASGGHPSSSVGVMVGVDVGLVVGPDVGLSVEPLVGDVVGPDVGPSVVTVGLEVGMSVDPLVASPEGAFVRCPSRQMRILEIPPTPLKAISTCLMPSTRTLMSLVLLNPSYSMNDATSPGYSGILPSYLVLMLTPSVAPYSVSSMCLSWVKSCVMMIVPPFVFISTVSSVAPALGTTKSVSLPSTS
mmetsp:Transcript_12505/g.36349  ORF Transcript_12505/g.36349 Transcript_12505/m.36349 type:complete len:227 (-) Transcript_12505:1140-1820(-)